MFQAFLLCCTGFEISEAKCRFFYLCRIPRDTQPGLMRVKDGAKKLMDLGLEFIPMEQIIKDAVECLKSKGFLS